MRSDRNENLVAAAESSPWSQSGAAQSTDARVTSIDLPAALSLYDIPPLRYTTCYMIFIIAAALDIILTWIILEHGGWEVNPIASTVIVRHGANGMIAFKFGLVVFTIVMCEIIGRKRESTGRRLAGFAALISSVPVLWSSLLLSL